MPPELTPRENLLRALKHEPPPWLPCPMFDGSVRMVGHGIAESAQNGPDAWGVRWESRHERSGLFPVTHPLNSPDAVGDYPFPQVRAETLLPAKVVKNGDRSRAVIMGDNGWGLFERAWLLLGMKGFFRWAHAFPDALRELIGGIAEVKLALTEGLVEEVGVDIVAYGDDWGMEDRLLMPREMWMEFIAPWQSRLYKLAKDGGSMVYQHSDGKVEALVPEIAGMGADILNIQRECNDWPGIIAKHREVTLWGGVSARTLDLGTDEAIGGEVAQCCDMGRAGGVVMAPGHSIRYMPEKLAVMREAWKAIGRYQSSAQV